MEAELIFAESDQIAVLTLSRPKSLDSAGKQAIIVKLEQLARREDLRVLIISASHPDAFLVDVAELANMEGKAAASFSQAGHRLANMLESLPFPVIAAVEGSALGGGCELVLACDIAVAGAQATFGQIEALGGVMPAFGGSWRLARRVGFQRAFEMMFTGAIIDAATARIYGLVLEVSATGRAMEAARGLAKRIVITSSASVAAIKRTAHAAWNQEASQIDAMEELAFPKLFGPEQSQRMRAFLAQSGKGEFAG